MPGRICRLFRTDAPRTPKPHVPSARPTLEAMEDRCLPTVTFQGGAVLPHVEAQALYLGTDWSNNSTDRQQIGYLDGFLNSVVHGSYMDMLTNAGYGVGRGTSDSGGIGMTTLAAGSALTDAAIRADLQTSITNGTLKPPDANRLYVVFVQPNVAVTLGNLTSRHDFYGYHGAFAGTTPTGAAADIHYAVIAYPGGTVNNAAAGWLAAADQLTEVASHELAEAVTDPNANYKALGWYDFQLNGEVADVVNGQTVWLNGYAVQRIADANDQAMTPAGATAAAPESFVLLNTGYLLKHQASGWTALASGVASVSDQGIDNFGQAMLDVVLTNGSAYEYHEGPDGGWQFLASGAKSARAGQGVSYVLLTNGTLDEYTDATHKLAFLSGNVASISAGTDRRGANAVDMILGTGAAWERSDSTGLHFITGTARQVSAGPMGYSVFIDSYGNAELYNETSGAAGFLAGAVSQVAAGFDANGQLQVEVVFKNGSASEYRAAAGTWTSLGTGVLAVSKPRAGLVDVIFTNGSCDEHSAGGWSYLTGPASMAG